MTRHSSHGSRSDPRPGITLLEVLVAMAILLMSIVAVGRLVDFGSDRALDAQSQARGTRLAHSKMAEVEAGAIGLTGSAQGAYDDEPDWSWDVAPESEGTPNLYKVTVKITRKLKGRDFEVSLTQYVIDPLQVGSASQIQAPSSSTGSSGTSGSSSSSGSSGGSSP